jgi:acyl-CoA synthetase (AMP-forming)/AMP-acid ligase II
MDSDGKLMPTGERGEIVVRGSLVMDGHYKNAKATAEASVHGWHHTGDIGYLDADNFLYIVDRAKDRIIAGGFNVYSVEVENALQAHETIQDCAGIGLPDEKWANALSLWCSREPGAPSMSPRERASSSSESEASKRRSKLRSGMIFRAPRSARC